jgi:hypothetical protein
MKLTLIMSRAMGRPATFPVAPMHRAQYATEDGTIVYTSRLCAAKLEAYRNAKAWLRRKTKP